MGSTQTKTTASIARLCFDWIGVESLQRMAPDVSLLDSNRKVALWQGLGGILSFGFCWCVLLVWDVICCGVCSDAGCALLTRPTFCYRFFSGSPASRLLHRIDFIRDYDFVRLLAGSYMALFLFVIVIMFACKQAPLRLCFCFRASCGLLPAGALIWLYQLLFVFDIRGMETAAPACCTQTAAASLACCRHCCSGSFWLSSCRK